MPNGESVSQRKIIIPERPPPKRRQRKSRKKSSKARQVPLVKNEHIEPSVQSVLSNPAPIEAIPPIQEKTDDVQTEEISIIPCTLITDAIPKELTQQVDSFEATEKCVFKPDEELTEVISPQFYEDTDLNAEEITEPLEETTPITQAHIHIAHRKELQHLFIFGCFFCFFSLIPYTAPKLAPLRPWNIGDPIPLLSLLFSNNQVVEDAHGNLEIANLDPNDPLLDLGDILEEDVAELPIEEQAIIVEEIAPIIGSNLPTPDAREPAYPSPLIMESHAMDFYFQKLWEIENKQETIARALVWGDSTIAADGIIKEIRKNMQDRFGNAGAGFLPISLNSSWTIRKEILRKYSGWNTENFVYGKLDSKRYGLAGMVSSTSAKSKASVTMAGPKSEEGRIPSTRYQIFYQVQPKGGSFTVDIGEGVTEIQTISETVEERTIDLFATNGSEDINLNTLGNGSVTIYGVALESQSTGVTWETFGVAGASISSMRKQDDLHIQQQIEARDPALLVYWTGGNELGYPSLKSNTGAGYKKVYREAIQKLKSGNSNASCLLIGPLDQGERVGGAVQSKPTLNKLIALQKEVAQELGCAYWDAQDAMGGPNSFAKWMSYTPTLASSDMSHLTGRGRKIIGDTLSDVLIRSYEMWLLNNPNGIVTPE